VPIVGENEDATDPRFIVEIGSHRFDPKEEGSRARRRANSDRTRLAAALKLPPEAVPGVEQELWILQFAANPDFETIRRYRDDYGLRLVAGVSSLTFIELMPAESADRIRRESQVRACIPYWSDLKKARSPLASSEGITGERLLRIGLVKDASEALTRKLDMLGCRPVAPATRYSGGFLLRVEVSEGRDPRDVLFLNEVEWIEDVLGYVPANASSSAVVQSGSDLFSTPIWDKSLHGEDQIIGIFEGELLDIAHDFFRDPAHPLPGPDHRKVLAIRSQPSSQTTSHATRVCGCAIGDSLISPGTHADRGGAWAAKLVYTDIDPLPDEGKIGAELRASAALGAIVHSMSWHEELPDPTKPAPYTADAAAFDDEIWRNESLLVIAALANTPNCDPNSKGFGGAPGTAKNPVAVAGTKDVPNQNTFHTGRPGTADGRRKPDLVAVGESVRSSDLTTPPPVDPFAFSSSCGTSFATPHVAAAAALVRQYFTEGWYPSGEKRPADQVTPTGSLLKAVLLNATVGLTGTSGYPTKREGWGRLQLDRTLYFEGDNRLLTVWDEPHSFGLDRDGERRTHRLEVPPNAASMKVTLVFNDPAGAKGASDPVVNMLDIEVMEPRGVFDFSATKFGYFGNDFSDKVSIRRDFVTLPTTIAGLPIIPNPNHSELKNNVRQVVIPNPAPGKWALNVRVHQIQSVTPIVPPRSTPAQGFALVATVELA